MTRVTHKGERLEELLAKHDPMAGAVTPLAHTRHLLELEARNDPAAIEERFSRMARAHAAETPALVAWVQQGNKLPRCYR